MKRVAEAAGKLQLREYLKRKPAELSGGQRQRVAIGRAITRDPKLFLLDEPLSNLDAALRVSMRFEIARLKNELTSTIVYVTHDQVEAMTLADRIVVMNRGRIEQVGSPLELYENPDNIFVAGFIGSPAMNFLPGKVEAMGENVASVNLGMGRSLRIPVAHNLRAGSDAMVGIRPEHLRVVAAECDDSVAGEAVLLEMLGSDTFIHWRNGDRSVIVRESGSCRLQRGENVHIRIDPASCYLFSATGERISANREASGGQA